MDDEGNLLVTAVIGLAAYGAFDLVRRTSRFVLHRRHTKAQQMSDEEAFRTYTRERENIRTRFDPTSAWNEATSPPAEYLAEVSALNRRFGGMLRRRNGWTDEDFENGRDV